MGQASKKRKQLPKNIMDCPDSEVAELIFGKRVKRELDKVVQAADDKLVNKPMKL